MGKLLVALLLLWLPISALADKAHLELYVFLDEQPAVGVEVLLDGQSQGRTDAKGLLALALSPGTHSLELRYRESVLAIVERNFARGEDVQILVSADSSGRPPQVSSESSLSSPGAASDKDQATPPGVLEGQVVTAGGKPVAEAEIFLSGFAQPVLTDAQGRFRIQAPAGTYSLSVSAPGYSQKVQEGVQFLPHKTVNLKLVLTPKGVEMPPFVVIEPQLAGSVTEVISQERTAAEVTDVLGAEQISRAGDSDVAAALKRASGVTIVGGSYAYIRGLGERYSNTLLNGISVPTPNPTRRVIPLDLFPAAMLDTIVIQKGYSAPMPGEFSGGIVDLKTRSIPGQFLLDLSGQIGFNTEASFAKGLRYSGGDFDWIGVDDGRRDLPPSLARAIAGGRILRPKTPVAEGFTPEEIERFGEKLSSVWDTKRDRLPPNGRINAVYGERKQFGNLSLGFLALGRWEQGWNNFDEARRDYSVNQQGKLELINDFDVQRTLREVRTNAYLNAQADWRDQHKLFGQVLLVRDTSDEVRFLEGFTNTEGADIRRVRLWWAENELFNWQIGTDHTFPILHDLNVRFLYSQATATRAEPKKREYRFDQIPSLEQFEFSRKADNNQTSFGHLEDQDDSFRLDLKLPFAFLSERLKGHLASGYWQTERERNSSIRRFRFAPSGPRSTDRNILLNPSLEAILSSENIGPEGFVLQETTRATDNYIATQELRAYYTELDTTFFSALRLAGGVRIEENQQTVTTFNLFDPTNQPITSTLDSRDALPGVTLTLLISEAQQLRLSWSKTLSRPDFRELSPAPFTDPETDRETVGNPKLQQAEFHNYDARWEYYFSPKENLSLGFFWKDLTNPIEKVLLPGPAGLLQLQNAGSATLYGVELDFRKELDFLHTWLAGFYLAGNYTWSQTEITLLPENLQTLTNPKRPLQGHSKHIVNVQLGYDNEDLGTQATLLYNTFSQRISQVGSLGAPDIYEDPFHQLDFVVQQKLTDHFSIQLRLQNLIDGKVRFTQGGEKARAFRRGRDIAISFNLRF
ncbi:MAG: TonB-dependent receptor [Methylohalobius sp.]|nr:TonB-dependent receptor [Methylohalobius sp.]